MLPEGDEAPDRIVYQAASPDEAALVTAAKHFGFFFFRFGNSTHILEGTRRCFILKSIYHTGRRSPTSINVRESHIEKIGRIQDVQYEILNVLEFNR